MNLVYTYVSTKFMEFFFILSSSSVNLSELNGAAGIDINPHLSYKKL